MPEQVSQSSSIDRLRELDGQIRKWTKPTVPGNFGFNERLRDLTPQELQEVIQLAETHDLPARLITCAYGFALLIHGPGEAPNIQPDLLLAIEGSQITGLSDKTGFASQEEVLRGLHHLTHRPRNAELLQWSGFEPLLEPIERYAY